MFYEKVEKIKEVLNETSGIDSFNEYDGILIKRLINTNLTSKQESKSGHQSHIAITGKTSFDFFPYVDIKNILKLKIVIAV